MTLRLLPLALLLLPASALAVDLGVLIEAWTLSTNGQDGSDGVDQAEDVVVTAANEIIVVGWLDGAADHGKDGYAVSYRPDTTVNWELSFDSGAVGKTLRASDERIQSVDLRPLTGALAWCGSTGVDGGGTDAAVSTWTWLERYEPLIPNNTSPPTLDFTKLQRDGNGTDSPVQRCQDVDYTTSVITGAGWSSNATYAGRWFTWRYDDATGFPTGAPLYYDDAVNRYAAVPDQAYGVARNPANNYFAIVGTRGFAGTPGSVLNNTDWYVRVYDDTGALLWEHAFQGDEALEDMALAVAFDPEPTRPDVVVVGVTNNGTDNATNSDRDWLIYSYNQEGDGFGGADENWITRFGVDSGHDEVATSIVYDNEGNILVGGSGSNVTTGHEVFRVAKLSPTSGDILQFWQGTDQGGDSRVLGVDTRNDRVMMAGYVDDGTGRDFAALMLEKDDDSDGFANSVDACPADATKNVDTGICGCNIPDIDSDADGTANCEDACATDPLKIEPGTCGCENPEVDTDSDGVLDCVDECPNDGDKTQLGVCGCNQPDVDEDGDGLLTCEDACLGTPAGEYVDDFGCSGNEGPIDTGGGGKDGGVTDGGACSCASSAPAAGLLPLLVALALVRRRRIRA